MNKKQRLDDVMALIKQNGYVTVKYLTEELHYSTATINRDLNLLEKQGLITRNYGGAEIKKTQAIPLVFRYHKMRYAKRKIASKAAEYIADGDTVFIDGSTTSQYMAQFILQKKNITVITNNTSLTSYLSENGIKCICLGGTVTEPPSMLGGPITLENAKRCKANKCFFATRGAFDDGKIGSTEMYYSLQIAMMENSDESFFLVDSGKINVPCNNVLCDFSQVDYVISDYDFKCGDKFPNTKIIKVS